MLTALNLYSVRVGNVGSFFAAAVDSTQAKAIGEQWRHEKGVRGDVTVRRHDAPKPVYTFAR